MEKGKYISISHPSHLIQGETDSTGSNYDLRSRDEQDVDNPETSPESQKIAATFPTGLQRKRIFHPVWSPENNSERMRKTLK